ncbi:hypothetical protein EG327_001569 [Venturia inaequalis]|uniref:Uncharacterized protein n=1 Tax=Venturia inaequalis TaxID=5025 RepID=A0A8H3VK65_VENIN|nr:hypothetical protein EG327_001569 [Venturia inaequalis]
MFRTHSFMKLWVAFLSFTLLASASPLPQNGVVTVTATVTPVMTVTVAQATVTTTVIQISTPATPAMPVTPATPATPTPVVTHITTWFANSLYSGSWQTFASSEGTCITFDATLDNHVTSYKLTNLGGPAGTETYCYLYDLPGCPRIDPAALGVVPYGWTYVGKDSDGMAAPFNDVVSSFRCLTKKFDGGHVRPDWLLEFWFDS